MVADIVDGSEVAAAIAAKHGAQLGRERDLRRQRRERGEGAGRSDHRALRQDRRAGEQRRALCAAAGAEVHRDRRRAVGQGDGGQPARAVPDGEARRAAHEARKRYGKIINIGSGTAYRGMPWMLHYVTTKGGIMAMTRAMSRELGDDGICVNTLMPGFTLSDTRASSTIPATWRPRATARSRARAQARRAARGPPRRADLPRLRRQRLRHRADHRGRRREREYVIELKSRSARPRESGDPVLCKALDSRFRGNERTG